MHIKKQRKCIACRNSFNQDELLRIAKYNNELVINIQHSGRGAYVCKNNECINQVIKKRLLNRAFKANLDNSIYEKLGEYEQNN